MVMPIYNLNFKFIVFAESEDTNEVR